MGRGRPRSGWSRGNRLVAPFPTGREQPEHVPTLVRMTRQPLPIEIDPETGAARHVDEATDRKRRVVNDLARPVGVELVERLLHVEIRDARAEMARDRGANGALRVVWCDDRIVGVSHRSDLTGSPEPAEIERFGLDDVY